MRRDQALIGTPTGVVRTRAENVKGVAPDDRWTAGELWRVIGWPWKPNLLKDGEEVPTSMRQGKGDGEEADGKRLARPSDEGIKDDADLRLDAGEVDEDGRRPVPDFWRER